jgi:hypothetical protein
MPKNQSFPKIDANPTKQFFISMLIRDIQLLEAIVDLVDNSIDGARQLRSAHDGVGPRYSGLRVELTLGESEFRIWDNCGGVDATVAKDYAFNFGRKEKSPAVEGGVGEFGVGMKRALFKIGNHFRIESKAERTSFVVDVDVDVWARGNEVPWEFDFHDYKPKLSKITREPDRFTDIKVDQLHDGVAEKLALGRFHNEVSVALGEQHQASIDQGLEISVNGKSVVRRRPVLLQSELIHPVHATLSLETFPGRPSVHAELFAGLSDRGEQSQAGWYVYCNDRLVVAADKTALTGWGRTEGGTLPNYHPQYRRFRGFAFLNAEEAGLLPWNTTKSSVDPNSIVYLRLLREMIPVMQEVIAYIDAADEEMESFPRGAGPINKAIKEARPVSLGEVPEQKSFSITTKPAGAAARTSSVQYRVNKDKLHAVKEHLGVDSAGQVGVETFDYYYRSEVE